MVVVLPGETSGEKTPPSAYSDRFRPYCLARDAVDLEDLDVDDDLGARLVVLLDDLLDDADDRRWCRAP